MSRLAPFAAPFVPLVRALVRYGPPAIRATIWNRLCEERLARLPHSFTVHTGFGRFSGDSQDLPSQYVYYFGQWEPQVTEWIARRLSPGCTFVDVGAHTGWYVLLAAQRVGPAGRVVAIEASPTNFSMLQANVVDNRLQNVRVINEAVWSTESQLPFFQGPDCNSGTSTLLPSFAGRRACECIGSVRARPLQSMLSPEELATLRVLKIDVEGAEREVLLGFEPALNSVPEDLEIFLEVNPAEYDVQEMLCPLFRRGFRAWMIPNPYQTEYYLDSSTRSHQIAPLEELSDTPRQQTDLLLSRTQPR